MNPITSAVLALVAGIVIQAYRTSRKLKCSIVDVLKGGGGPADDDDGRKGGGWPADDDDKK